MATNFIQHGEYITVPAPANVSSGDAVLVGSLFGVAQTDALSGADVALHTCGVYDLPKATGTAWTVGVRLYWDVADGEVNTSSSGNTLIGVAAAAAASGDATGYVRLNGSFTQ